MEIALPLATLAAFILAALFGVRARSRREEIIALRGRLRTADEKLEALKENSDQKSQKDTKRVGEVEELRDRQKGLRRRLNEAQEQTKKLTEQSERLKRSEGELRTRNEHTQKEASDLSQQIRALRAELETSRGRKGVTRPEAPAPVPVIPRPHAEIAELEAKVKDQQLRVTDAESKAKLELRKAQDTARDAERLKAKISTSEKLYIVQKGELELWKDRYRTLEQRLNRTLREVDALHRGVLALERRLPQAAVEEARAEASAASVAEATPGAAAPPPMPEDSSASAPPPPPPEA